MWRFLSGHKRKENDWQERVITRWQDHLTKELAYCNNQSLLTAVISILLLNISTPRQIPRMIKTYLVIILAWVWPRDHLCLFAFKHDPQIFVLLFWTASLTCGWPVPSLMTCSLGIGARISQMDTNYRCSISPANSPDLLSPVSGSFITGVSKLINILRI